MHMADALISPAVGATMWGATAVATVYCARKVREEADAAKVPLMGVSGAFIFAAQMLNFTIPATGSSGHLGGGLILAILLGPEAAFLVMASVLTVQALFFADGGLLALGANIFNMGFFSAFVAYPLVYRPIVGTSPSRARLFTGALVASVVALQLGALAVVLQTVLSGVSELPLGTFLLLMSPIHLVIGIVEGLVTGGVVLFVERAQPELLTSSPDRSVFPGPHRKHVLIGLAVGALVFAGAVSWFASANPDGLEWSIERITGSTQITGVSSPAHEAASSLQSKTAVLPGYDFKRSAEATAAEDDGASAPDAGTSASGLVGAVLVLLVVAAVGLVLGRRGRKSQA